MINHTLVSAIDDLGPVVVAKVCGVSYQAVQKWRRRGRLPRTEWTGETRYADLIVAELKGKVRAKQLRGTIAADQGDASDGGTKTPTDDEQKERAA